MATDEFTQRNNLLSESSCCLSCGGGINNVKALARFIVAQITAVEWRWIK
ncbi:MAG: hypothetical protein WCL70_13675 [Paludibacter sp.]